MRSAFRPEFLPTMVGSLPHTDPVAACDLVLRHLPEIPAWPQLPRRDPRESMYAQFSRGFPGAVVEEGRVFVDRRRDLTGELEALYARYLAAGPDAVAPEVDPVAPGADPVAPEASAAPPDPDAAALDADYAAGLARFLTLDLAGARAAKGQIVGPVSWGLTVTDGERRSILYDDLLADALAKHLRLQAAWQERALRALAPQTILFVDEPYMASFGSAFVAVERAEVVALLEEVFGGLAGLKGVHCCGNTDWSLLLETSADVLNFDAYTYAEAFSLYPEALRGFLERGGIVAWGIVPTAADAQVMAETVESLTRRLWEALRLVASRGVPLEALLDASLVTPACGMGTLSEGAAVRALELLAGVSGGMRREVLGA